MLGHSAGAQLACMALLQRLPCVHKLLSRQEHRQDTRMPAAFIGGAMACVTFSSLRCLG